MAAPIHMSREFVNFFFTQEAVEARPTGWELALHTGNPGEGDDYEVSSSSYAREAVSFESYLEPDNGSFYEAQNDMDVVFSAGAPADDYRVTHYSIRDSSSGDCLAIGQLEVPIKVTEGVVVSFPQTYIKVRGI